MPHVLNRIYMNYILLTNEGELEFYDETCWTKDANKWKLAMKDEMNSLISKPTWELIKLPMGKKAFR